MPWTFSRVDPNQGVSPFFDHAVRRGDRNAPETCPKRGNVLLYEPRFDDRTGTRDGNIEAVEQFMRQIGLISNLDLAERFADHLRAEGIACTIDQAPGGFRVWVHDDDRVVEAKEELPRFLSEPYHDRYRDAADRAMARVREATARLKSARARTVVMTDKWSRPASQTCPATFILIGLSLLVAFFTSLNPQRNDPFVDRLWFSNDGTLQPIFRGEVWRIITPIFLHFGLMHLVFNMLWLRQFGLQMETLLGTAKFLGIVLTIAVFSNFAEFWFHSQWFGGMSGVDYGLFGYLWVKGRMEPESGLGVPQQTVTVMLIWYALCVVGVIPNVANWAHGVGLVTGVTIAFGGVILKPLMRRQ